ncbi:hypothetical protein ANANG_G00180620 [Anguilla anguilla]|uniref:Uncharacterized protein n=1 Tax=Anguilla anguilla TaxID=7936 RepID=A0A9D3RUY9_ANGAN|nr:hypothetical protein ANANG_G00180620 [Anguilla anguilla]
MEGHEAMERLKMLALLKRKDLASLEGGAAEAKGRGPGACGGRRVRGEGERKPESRGWRPRSCGEKREGEHGGRAGGHERQEGGSGARASHPLSRRDHLV